MPLAVPGAPVPSRALGRALTALAPPRPLGPAPTLSVPSPRSWTPQDARLRLHVRGPTPTLEALLSRSTPYHRASAPSLGPTSTPGPALTLSASLPHSPPTPSLGSASCFWLCPALQALPPLGAPPHVPAPPCAQPRPRTSGRRRRGRSGLGFGALGSGSPLGEAIAAAAAGLAGVGPEPRPRGAGR